MVHCRHSQLTKTIEFMQNKNLNVVVLAGGSSAEAEVSRQSAAQVKLALSNTGFRVAVVELDKDCPSELLKIRPDVVFPALHGPPGEDGTVQGLLEMLALCYVGSDVRGSAMAMDKAVAKSIFKRHGLPIMEDYIVEPGLDLAASAKDIERLLGPSVVIKPLNQGSALGVQLLPNGGDIATALEQCLVFGRCLVEPFVLGREVTVGVLETDDGSKAHPVIEICTAENEWYDYHNRYTPGQSNHVMPAQMSDELTEQLQSTALLAHNALGLRDLSRADFILTDTDQIVLLEVNALPGMTPVSLYPEGAAAIGYDFDALIEHLVMRAFNRSN
jgi:D-alanine-D-alanine ligase